MKTTTYFQTLIRLILLIANAYFLFYVFNQGFTISIIVLLILICFQIALFMDYMKGLFLDVEKYIDCLLHEDYSVTIPAHKRKNTLFKKAALLIERHKAKSSQQSSEQLIFSNIIESLAIGILILRKDTRQNIEVYQINNAFTNFLNIPKYYNWELLKQKITPLFDIIQDWKHVRHVVTLNINQNKEEFFLKTSITQTSNYHYLVVSLETIQQLIDKKEKEAWYKLMNVMSHEIINTITPISSLAENLESLLQETPDEETLHELSQGLSIIKKRSHHLNSFVDTYRKLAELPLPEKEDINLTFLVENTLKLFAKDCSEKGISIIVNSEKMFFINADKEQIEQVIINLISNSIFALETVENPKITVTIKNENEQIVLSVTDNGIGIPKDIKDNIFVPYFTTRKNGSGIGLTLAKSIVESHGGTIFFNSKAGQTCFCVRF